MTHRETGTPDCSEGGAPQPDFRALFESAPDLYLALAPDFRIIAASDAYLSATKTRREDVVGRGLFEVFPDNPDDPGATGTRNLRDSLERVLATGRPHTMAIQKYDIRRPESEGGGFEERHWSPTNTPVLGAQNRVTAIIHQVTDVTDVVRLRSAEVEQNRANAELRTAHDRFRLVIQCAPSAMLAADEHGIIQLTNTQLERLVGAKPRSLNGKGIEAIFPPEHPEAATLIRQWILRPEAEPRTINQQLVGLRADGTQYPLEMSLGAAAMGSGVLVLVAIADVTERARSERRHAMMMAELDHRVKNTLAAVLSLADLTAASSKSLAEFHPTFTGRLRAMARAHEALAATHWAGIRLHELVRMIVSPMADGGNRLTVEGDDVLLPSQPSASICATLHELATNAAKYGAFSTPAGAVHISWNVDRGGVLRIVWTESGVESICAPTRTGFGTQMIRGAITHELRGSVDLRYDPPGLVCSIRAPLRLEPARDAGH